MLSQRKSTHANVQFCCDWVTSAGTNSLGSYYIIFDVKFLFNTLAKLSLLFMWSSYSTENKHRMQCVMDYTITREYRQVGRPLADIFKSIFLNENVCIVIQTWLFLFQRVQLTMCQHWYRQRAFRRHTITWTDSDLIPRSVNASPGPNV